MHVEHPGGRGPQPGRDDAGGSPPGARDGPTGTVFRVARFSVHDGPGIRTTVFLKGCPLRCPWCHSPESQRLAPELVLHEDRCLMCGSCRDACDAGAIGPGVDRDVTDFGRCRACGACVAACPSGARELAGREMTVDEVMAEVERDRVFFDESGGGVTFSGGEPFMQPRFLEALLRSCRARGLRGAVDTCGLADPPTFAAIVRLAHLVLFDVKIVDGARHQAITGQSNVRVLANLHVAAASGVPVRVRFPLVPGFTDGEDNVRGLAALLRSEGIRDVDVLPYHRAGAGKYPRLGLEYPLAAVPVPTASDVAAVVNRLRALGLRVSVG